MPIPILFLGIAAVTGAVGLGAGTKAGFDHNKAKKLNDNSSDRIEEAANRLDLYRKQCARSLERLGGEKIDVIEKSMVPFVDSFSRIKNVDFTESVGLDELTKFHIDQKDFEEMHQMQHIVLSTVGGVAAGLAGGALTAFGAYSAATTFAVASTGTAISTLSGAAATNATLAFFGGGSLAAGGLGMAGGTVVLGGLVAGPALMIMGLVIGAKMGKNLEEAKINAAQATEACEQMENGALQCIAIRRRTDMFYTLLARLDVYFRSLLEKMNRIVLDEGTDYRSFSTESKKTILKTASLAVTVKSVLDTPILSEDGSLTDESATFLEKNRNSTAALE